MELDKATMEAMKELANLHTEISTSKVVAASLKENIGTFLDERAVLEAERLQEVFAQSSDLIKSIGENYDIIHSVSADVMSYARFLVEAHDNFKGVVDAFTLVKEQWDKDFHEDSIKLSMMTEQVRNDMKALRDKEKDMEVREEILRTDSDKLVLQQRSLREQLNNLKK